MIVYYVKSDGEVLATDKSTKKEALPAKTLEDDLLVMFPELVDSNQETDAAYKIVNDSKAIIPGGKWDSKTEKMTENPPSPKPHPDQVEADALRQKMANKTGDLDDVMRLLEISGAGKNLVE